MLVNINVLVDVDDRNVIIKVSDKGTGIPLSKQPHIFELYVQGDVSLARLKEGSGVGLSLVKSLVDLHESTVYIETSCKSGTTMVVTIPIKLITKGVKEKTSSNLTGNNIIEKINLEFSDIL